MDDLTKFLNEIYSSDINMHEDLDKIVEPASDKDLSPDALNAEILSTNNIPSDIDGCTTTQLNISHFKDNGNMSAPNPYSIERTTTPDAVRFETVITNSILSNVVGGTKKKLNIGPLRDDGNMSAPTLCSVEQPTTSASGNETTTSNYPNIEKLLNKFVIVDIKKKKILRVFWTEDQNNIVGISNPQVPSTEMTAKTELKKKATPNEIDPHKKVIIHQNIEMNQHSSTDIQPSESLLTLHILPIASGGSHHQEGSFHSSTQFMTNFDVTQFQPMLKKTKLEVEQEKMNN